MPLKNSSRINPSALLIDRSPIARAAEYKAHAMSNLGGAIYSGMQKAKEKRIEKSKSEAARKFVKQYLDQAGFKGDEKAVNDIVSNMDLSADEIINMGTALADLDARMKQARQNARTNKLNRRLTEEQIADIIENRKPKKWESTPIPGTGYVGTNFGRTPMSVVPATGSEKPEPDEIAEMIESRMINFKETREVATAKVQAAVDMDQGLRDQYGNSLFNSGVGEGQGGSQAEGSGLSPELAAFSEPFIKMLNQEIFNEDGTINREGVLKMQKAVSEEYSPEDWEYIQNEIIPRGIAAQKWLNLQESFGKDPEASRKATGGFGEGALIAAMMSVFKSKKAAPEKPEPKSKKSEEETKSKRVDKPPLRWLGEQLAPNLID